MTIVNLVSQNFRGGGGGGGGEQTGFEKSALIQIHLFFWMVIFSDMNDVIMLISFVDKKLCFWKVSVYSDTHFFPSGWWSVLIHECYHKYCLWRENVCNSYFLLKQLSCMYCFFVRTQLVWSDNLQGFELACLAAYEHSRPQSVLDCLTTCSVILASASVETRHWNVHGNCISKLGLQKCPGFLLTSFLLMRY